MYKRNHDWIGKCPCTHHLDKYCLKHWQWDLIEQGYHPDTLDKKDVWYINMYILVEQDSRTPKMPSPPQSPALVLGTLDYTKKEGQVYHTEKNERCNVDECSELSIGAVDHISDQLHKEAFLIQKSKNNNQSDLSDYASSTP